MKKAVCALIALALCTGAGTTAFAAETQNVGTTFTCEVKADPTYFVSIPAGAALTEEGTPVTLEAKDVANLPDGQKISVTLESTGAFRNQMVLKGENLGYYVRYQITTAAGETLETTGNGAEIVGKELVSFTGNGSQSYTAKILPSFADRPDTYSGTITYGISLTDAQ